MDKRDLVTMIGAGCVVAATLLLTVVAMFV
jgi:hypothetical protein